jgi:putative spermidine/putrescine transport system substrate-binding protein
MDNITRRKLLALAGTALGGAVLASCGGGGSSGGGSQGGGGGQSNKKVKVTMFVFLGGDLGVMPKAFAKEYMAAHPNVTIEIYENSNTVGYPKMLAAKQTTPDQPLVNMGFFNAQTTAQGDLDGMWNKLDYGALSHAKDVLPVLKRKNQQGIGLGSDQVGIVYNTKALTPAPTAWADLWDDKVKGKVTYFDYYWQGVLMAARANGGSLTKMDPGWTFWKQHAKWIRTIVTSNPQYLDVLTNGTASITSYFNGTGLQWKRGGAPLDYVPPKEGAISVPVYLTTVKGNTQDQEQVCHDIVNQMLSPKWCQQWATTSIQVPGSSAVKLPQEFGSLPAFQKQTIDHFIPVDWVTVAKQTADWKKRWDQDVKANI